MHLKNGTFLAKLYKEHDLILVIDMKKEVQEATLMQNIVYSYTRLISLLLFMIKAMHAITSYSVSSIPNGVVVEFFKAFPGLNFDMFMIFTPD